MDIKIVPETYSILADYRIKKNRKVEEKEDKKYIKPISNPEKGKNVDYRA